jgi:osmotically-inducible protein OsmY
MNVQLASSDQRIQEAVRLRLSSDREVDVSKVLVLVRNGQVTLDGSVDTRQMRRRLGNVVKATAGVTSVKNRVVVKLGLLSEVALRLRLKYSGFGRAVSH